MKKDKRKPGKKSRTAGPPAKVIIGLQEAITVGINKEFERGSVAMVVDAGNSNIPGAAVRWTATSSDSAYPVTVRETGPTSCMVSGVGGPAEGYNYKVRLTATSSTHPHISGQSEYEIRTLDIKDPAPDIEREPAKVTIGLQEGIVVGINKDFERGSVASVQDEIGWEVPGAAVRWAVSTSDSAYPVTVRETGPKSCMVSGVGGPAEGHTYKVRLTATSSTHPDLSGQGEYEVKTLDIEDPAPEITIEPASPPHGYTYPMYGDVPLAVKVTGIPAEEGSNYLVRYTSGMGPPHGTGTVFPNYPSSTTANPPQPGDVTLAAVLMRNGSEVTRTYFTYTVVGSPKTAGPPAKVIIGLQEAITVGINKEFERGSVAMVVDAGNSNIPGAAVRWTATSSDSAYPVTVRETGPTSCMVSGVGGPAEGYTYKVRLTATSSTHPHISGQSEYEVRTLDIGADPDMQPKSPPHNSTYNAGQSMTLQVSVTGLTAEEGENYLVQYVSAEGITHGMGSVFPNYPVSVKAQREPGVVAVWAILKEENSGKEVMRTAFSYTVVAV